MSITHANSSLTLLLLLLSLINTASAASDPGGFNATNCTSFDTVFPSGSSEYKYCNCKETSSAENIPLGIILIICGSVSLNMGNNIMSLGHRQEAEEKDKTDNPVEEDGEKKNETCVNVGEENPDNNKVNKIDSRTESPTAGGLVMVSSPTTPYNSISGKKEDYLAMTPSPGTVNDDDLEEVITPESVDPITGKERRIRASMDKQRKRKNSIGIGVNSSMGVPLAGPAAGTTDIVDWVGHNLAQLPQHGIDGFNLMGQAGAMGAGVLRDSLQGAAIVTRDLASGSNGAVVHIAPNGDEGGESPAVGGSKTPTIDVTGNGGVGGPPQLLHSQSAPTTPSNEVLGTPREVKSGEKEEETDVEKGKAGKEGEGEKEEEEEEPPKKNFTWFIGTVIFVGGSLLTFGSFGFAPQSILAPMECSQFVSNVFFARIILGEKVTHRQIVGTAALILGIICIIIAHTEASKGQESSHRLDAEEMVVYFTSEGTAFWIYMMAAGGLLVVSHTTFLKYRAAKARGETLYRHGLIEPGCFAIVSALVGTVSLLFVKCISELLIKTLDSECGENQFTHWFTYVSIICWIPTVSFWLSRMNWGLALYSPLLVIPLLQCGFVFFAILIGGIYFHEFNALIQSPYLALFIGGVGGMFYGVFLLAPKDGMH
ncbi:hypothetical protein TrLO_g3644 [Triparma laevis f. longispina]|uniref:Uncharacterized protein n=1 Tax=Triparma laevis f. longispina TaxID=1714387 RepID=A0A9W7C7F9_9STRA|nr:hypothetical protein TrLO_g3644 [Triparma laevis f. longispina]